MKRGRRGITIIIVLVIIIIPLISAGVFSDWWGRITGRLTSGEVDLSITVGAGTTPVITHIWNASMGGMDISGGPNDGPTKSYIWVNFTVIDADGTSNLNSSTAKINISKTGEETRSDALCTLNKTVGNFANYTCNMTMWWYDGAGAWNINAYIKDNNGNVAYNASDKTFQVGTTDGVVLSPSALNWTEITAGDTDKLSSNDPQVYNNTGNVNKWIEINSTHLKGENNPAYGLWAGGFSINAADACDTGTTMTWFAYANITSAWLPKGNFTINNGTAGQERLYFCLETSDANLTSQAYSTASHPWTAKIVDR